MLAAGPASAADSDGDGVDDAFELATERTVSVRETPAASPLAMHVTSQSVDSPTNDWFRIAYEPGEFDVEYVRESEGGLVSSEFQIEFRNLVEWRDTNGDGGIQWSEILDRTSLGSSAFGGVPIQHDQVNSEDGGVVHTIRIRSNGNEVSINLTIAQRFFRVSASRVLTPMEIKMDTTLDRPLSNMGARLGLELRIETDRALIYEAESWAARKGFADAESAVNVSTGSGDRLATVFFAWSNVALAESQLGQVSIAGPREDYEASAYDMVLGYPQGASPASAFVQHNASLGVVSASYDSWFLPPVRPLNADLLLFSVSLVAVSAVIVGTMVAARRRRMK